MTDSESIEPRADLGLFSGTEATFARGPTRSTPYVDLRSSRCAPSALTPYDTPLLAIWAAGSMCFNTGAAQQKAKTWRGTPTASPPRVPRTSLVRITSSRASRRGH
jgi:hypothetical protein